MNTSNIISNVITANLVGRYIGAKKPAPPMPGEITDAILCEDGSIMLCEDGSYMQLETQTAGVKLKNDKK